MHVLRPLGFDEVCREILRHEVKTRRNTYADLSEEDLGIIEQEEFGNLAINAKRKEILYSKRNGLMLRIPPDTSWYLVKVSEEDFRELYTIRTDPWIELSQNRGLLMVAAETYLAVLSGTVEVDAGTQSTVKSIEEFVIPSITSGTINRRLVLLRSMSNRTAIIDGNHRAVGMYAQQVIEQSPPLEEFEACFGLSRLGCIWNWDSQDAFLPAFMSGTDVRVLIDGWLSGKLPTSSDQPLDQTGDHGH